MASKKLYVALICLIMAVSMLLSGCGGALEGTPGDAHDSTAPSDSAVTTAASADTTAASTPSAVTLFEGGQAKFRLIRGDNASEQETTAALNIRKSILSLFPDASFEFTSDFSKDGTYDSNAVEILVGRTKHPE